MRRSLPIIAFVMLLLLSSNPIFSQEIKIGSYNDLYMYYLNFEHKKLTSVLKRCSELSIEFGWKSDHISQKNKEWIDALSNTVLIDKEIIKSLMDLTLISHKLRQCNIYNQANEKKCEISEVKFLISDRIKEILEHTQETIKDSEDWAKYANKEGRYIVKNEYLAYSEMFKELYKILAKHYKSIEF